MVRTAGVPAGSYDLRLYQGQSSRTDLTFAISLSNSHRAPPKIAPCPKSVAVRSRRDASGTNQMCENIRIWIKHSFATQFVLRLGVTAALFPQFAPMIWQPYRSARSSNATRAWIGQRQMTWST